MIDAIIDFCFEKLLPPAVAVILVLGLAFVLIGLPVWIFSTYKQSKSPTFTLYKNEWSCTNTQRVPVTTYIKTGDVLLPITTYKNVCHQWSRQP